MAEILLAVAGVVFILALLGIFGYMAYSSFSEGMPGFGLLGSAILVIIVCFLGAAATGDWKTNTVSIEVTNQGCYRSEMVGKITRHIETTCPRDLSR